MLLNCSFSSKKKQLAKSKLKNVHTILKRIKTIHQLHTLFIKQTALMLKSKLKTLSSLLPLENSLLHKLQIIFLALVVLTLKISTQCFY